MTDQLPGDTAPLTEQALQARVARLEDQCSELEHLVRVGLVGLRRCESHTRQRCYLDALCDAKLFANMLSEGLEKLGLASRKPIEPVESMTIPEELRRIAKSPWPNRISGAIALVSITLLLYFWFR